MKKTVVSHWLGGETRKTFVIKRVDKSQTTTVKRLQRWCFRRWPPIRGGKRQMMKGQHSKIGNPFMVVYNML